MRDEVALPRTMVWPMAETAPDPSTITLITLEEARALVTATLLSGGYAKARLIKWLHDGLIGWQYEHVFGIRGPKLTFEQEAERVWSHKTLVDFKEGLARKVTCQSPLRYVTVIGIRVVREDIERELARMPRTQFWTAQNPPKKPSVAASMPAPVTASPPPPKLRPLPRSIAKKVARAPQMRRAALALWQDFPDGKSPKTLSAERCRDRLSSAGYWKAENEAFGMANPSADVVGIAMNLFGRTDD
jgi:hypothetical protein